MYKNIKLSHYTYIFSSKVFQKCSSLSKQMIFWTSALNISGICKFALDKNSSLYLCHFVVFSRYNRFNVFFKMFLGMSSFRICILTQFFEKCFRLIFQDTTHMLYRSSPSFMKLKKYNIIIFKGKLFYKRTPLLFSFDYICSSAAIVFCFDLEIEMIIICTKDPFFS